MIDANHAYDATAAIELGRRVAELEIGWFEEPVPPEDLARLRGGAPRPADPGRRRRVRVHPLRLSRAAGPPLRRHCPARYLCRGRPLGVQEDRGHGERVRGPLRAACLGIGHSARGLAPAPGGASPQPALPLPDRAAARVRPNRASDPAGGAQGAAGARAWLGSVCRPGRALESRSTARPWTGSGQAEARTARRQCRTRGAPSLGAPAKVSAAQGRSSRSFRRS